MREDGVMEASGGVDVMEEEDGDDDDDDDDDNDDDEHDDEEDEGGSDMDEDLSLIHIWRCRRRG